jgi:hypothetical protein
VYQKEPYLANRCKHLSVWNVRANGDSMMRLSILFLLLILSVAEVRSQQSTATAPPNPCVDVNQKQFDFWVGEWDLTWPGPSGGETGHRTNSIQRILDGCIVQESFSGQNSMPLRGTSVLVFDTRANHWKQTWVDNQGAYLDFVGDFKDGQMILQREATGPGGKKMLQRMVWKNIGAREFDWSWESSNDGGKTWQVQWPIHYKRR